MNRVSRESKDLFELFLSIFWYFGSFNGALPRDVEEIHHCCGRTKSGLFLEVSEVRGCEAVLHIRFWTPWGAVPAGFMPREKEEYIFSLIAGIDKRDHLMQSKGVELYPIYRHSLPTPILFSDEEEEKDVEEIGRRAAEWRQLFESAKNSCVLLDRT